MGIGRAEGDTMMMIDILLEGIEENTMKMIGNEDQEEKVIHPEGQVKIVIIILEEVIAILMDVIIAEMVEDTIMIDMIEAMEDVEEMIEGREVDQAGEMDHRENRAQASEEVRPLRTQDRSVKGYVRIANGTFHRMDLSQCHPCKQKRQDCSVSQVNQEHLVYRELA